LKKNQERIARPSLMPQTRIFRLLSIADTVIIGQAPFIST